MSESILITDVAQCTPELLKANRVVIFTFQKIGDSTNIGYMPAWEMEHVDITIAFNRDLGNRSLFKAIVILPRPLDEYSDAELQAVVLDPLFGEPVDKAMPMKDKTPSAPPIVH